MTETKQEIDEQGEALGLGKRLKKARETKKLSLNEVSAQLRIARSCIEAIENEAWAILPCRTYTRGYFISYVKLMDLPEETLLSLFNLQYIEPTKVASTVSQKQSPELKLKVLAVAIPLLLATIWFSWQFLSDSNKPSNQAAWMDKRDNASHSPLNEIATLNIPTRKPGFDDTSQYGS